MPDEETEQTVDVTTGAEETASEAPAGVVADAVESVAGDVEAVPATPVVDLSSDDGIKAAADAHPTLRGYFEKLQADAANAARQRRDAELRRDQGTSDRATAYHQWVVDQLNNGADPAELARQTPLYVKANFDTNRYELSRRLLDAASEGLSETEAAPLKALADALEDGDPEGMQKVAQAALSASLAKVRAEAKAEAEAEANARWEARLEADRKAAALEAEIATRTNAPNARGVPPAAGGPVTWQSIDSQYTDSQWQNLPPELRKELSQQADQARLIGTGR